MAKILIKTFIISKEGDLITCQDRIGINLLLGRFAVADGVSNSYHPEIIAEALCNAFVAEDYPYEEWSKLFNERMHNDICSRWNKWVENYAKTLSGRRLRHEIFKRKDLPAGASTFAGITIDISKKEIRYNIIGDSSLFIKPNEYELKCICTASKKMRNNVVYFLYDNHPSCILADNKILGEWISGVLPLQEGYIALMTDGAAEWLQDASMENNQAIEILWNLDTHKSFINFVEECRSSQCMEDDISIILIKVPKDNLEGFELVHSDVLPQLLDNILLESGNNENNIDYRHTEDIEQTGNPSLAISPKVESIITIVEDPVENKFDSEKQKISVQDETEAVVNMPEDLKTDVVEETIQQGTNDSSRQNLFFKFVNVLKKILAVEKSHNDPSTACGEDETSVSNSDITNELNNNLNNKK